MGRSFIAARGVNPAHHFGVRSRRRPEQPKRDPGSIYYPKAGNFSEFEIQAFVYQAIRSLGFDVRGEVYSSNGSCRFDLVVFNVSKKAAAIIEVKSSGAKAKSRSRVPRLFRADESEYDRQLRRYRRYSIPVHVIEGMAEAERWVETLNTHGQKGLVAPSPTKTVAAEGVNGKGMTETAAHVPAVRESHASDAPAQENAKPTLCPTRDNVVPETPVTG